MLIRLFEKLIYKKMYINFELFLILQPARQRMMKTNDGVRKHISIQNITKIPENIDGTCIYKLPCDPADRHKSSKDRRSWKKSIRSDKGIYKSAIAYFAKSIKIHQIIKFTRCFCFTKNITYKKQN